MLICTTSGTAVKKLAAGKKRLWKNVSSYIWSGFGKLQPTDQKWPAVYFCMAYQLRIFLHFERMEERQRQK